MWRYSIVEDGFKISYDNTDPDTCIIEGFDFNIPFKTYPTPDTVLVWDEDKIEKLVRGLNTKAIPLKFNCETGGISFKMNIPPEVYK